MIRVWRRYEQFVNNEKFGTDGMGMQGENYWEWKENAVFAAE
jgi:hypothetical protein